MTTASDRLARVEAEIASERAARADQCKCGHDRNGHEFEVGVCRCYRDCSCFSFVKVSS